MPKIGQEPIYKIRKAGRDYIATTIYRVLGYKIREGVKVVRYEREWFPLHNANDLYRFVSFKERKKRSKFWFDGYLFPEQFKLRPFIRDWELSVGTYPTFGPGGI